MKREVEHEEILRKKIQEAKEKISRKYEEYTSEVEKKLMEKLQRR